MIISVNFSFERKMRKSATTILPRSTSTQHTLSSLTTKTATTTKPRPLFPHSKSQQSLSTNHSHSSICSSSPTTIQLSRYEPILNHDTDSLKIGDRIYVNGQWLGVILYIGETTLGKGEWAGIVLDDASLGKTNGIVRGRCYFQTTDNRGIFCRLTKLTREKILSD